MFSPISLNFVEIETSAILFLRGLVLISINNLNFEIFSKKENDNIIRGLGTVLDGENNFIHSNEKFTAVLGLDNIVVVNTNDATLVVPRDKVEKVKDLVSWLDKKNFKDLL